MTNTRTIKLKTTIQSCGRPLPQNPAVEVGLRGGVATYAVHHVPIHTTIDAVARAFDLVCLVEGWEADWADLRPGAIIRTAKGTEVAP